MSLQVLANRPAESITDAEAETAIEVINANDRVTKAVLCGRDMGRVMVTVEMEGLNGKFSIGRVIGQIATLDRADKAALEIAKAKEAKKLARKAYKPAPKWGEDKEFDEYYEDTSGLSQISAFDDGQSDERNAAYAAYSRSAKPAMPRWTGPTLKGLTGSTKQKHWAARIREEWKQWLGQHRIDALTLEHPQSKWWIENRNSIR